MLAYNLSTEVSCDNGEQPKFHTEYCRRTTPPYLNEEELTRELCRDNIEEKANGWNTLGRMYGTTLARARFELAKIKYEVLDLSLTLYLSLDAYKRRLEQVSTSYYRLTKPINCDSELDLMLAETWRSFHPGSSPEL